MLRGFYTNAGMGADNIISEDIATFLCFDRLIVDGKTLDYLLGEGAGPEQLIFKSLIEHGVLEPQTDAFGPNDVSAAQTLFLKTLPELDIEGIDAIRAFEPGPSFERQINRIRGESRDQIRGAYYVFLKNYLAMVAARQLGCPIVNASDGDIGCRLAIMEYDAGFADLPKAHSLSFLLPALRSLLDTLDLQIAPFPICVTREGTPAEAMSLSNQMLGQIQAEESWHLERGIDINRSIARLKTFLSLWQIDRRQALQSHLLKALDLIDPAMPPNWMDRAIDFHKMALAGLQHDFAQYFKRPLEALPALDPPARTRFWAEHPAHAWYAYLREDWMEAVSGRGTLPKLH